MKVDITEKDCLGDIREFHAIFPEQIDEVGKLAGFYGKAANRYKPGSDPWLASVDKLSGLIEAMNKLQIRAGIRWTSDKMSDRVEAVVIDSQAYGCADSEPA